MPKDLLCTSESKEGYKLEKLIKIISFKLHNIRKRRGV